MAQTNPNDTNKLHTITPSTVYVPLTTIFTPPPDCRLPIVTNGSDFTINNRLGTTTVWITASSCYPQLSWSIDVTLAYWFVFSPGVCPSGFTGIPSTSITRPLAPPVTYVTCCPTDATRGLRYGCVSSPVCPITIVRNNTTSIVDSTYVLVPPQITVAWQQSDLDLFTPRSAPILSTISSTQSVPARTSLPPATSSPSSHRSSSRGEDAGVGVGASIGGLAIIGLVLWALYERRKRKRAAAIAPSEIDQGQNAGSADEGKSELPAMSIEKAMSPTSPPGGDQKGLAKEADGREIPWEMSSDNVRAESDGGWRGAEAPLYEEQKKGDGLL